MSSATQLTAMDNNVSQIYYIPPKPGSLTEIQKVVSQDSPDVMEIAAIISEDVGLSAAVLQIINSPFYGMCREIYDIKQSVVLLGVDRVYHLVTSYYLKQGFKKESCISLERFWDEATDIANTMLYLHQHTHISDDSGELIKEKIPLELLYSVGLFHDCGIPAIAEKHSDYKKLLMFANEKRVSSIPLENKRYKASHAVVGYYICRSWHFPPNICDLILKHHDINYLKNCKNKQDAIVYAVLKAAENIFYKFRHLQCTVDWLEVKDDVLETLSIDESEYDELYENRIAML